MTDHDPDIRRPAPHLQSSHLDEEIRTDELVRATMTKGEKEGSGSLWDRRSAHRTKKLPKGIAWAVGGLIVLFLAGFGASYYVARRALVTTMGARVGLLQTGLRDLSIFDFGGAEKSFTSAGAAPGDDPMRGLMSLLSSVFSGGTDAFGAFNDLSSNLSSFTRGFASAQNDFWTMLAAVPIGNGGPAAASSTAATPSSAVPLADDLRTMQSSLAAIAADVDTLAGVASSLGEESILNGTQDALGSFLGGSGSSGGYLAFSAELRSAQNFMDAFVPWFTDASTTHHVLVLLENPSEMRPGGGFIGSYADVSVRGGAITGIAVHDVADADVAFTDKIVPPPPLQLEGTGWRPADGNWFLDFPTSASATISLFERSGMYRGASGTPPVAFDAAVAVTPQAMSDILAVVGPVSIPDADLGIVPAAGAPTSTTFTADGLTEEIQSVVQEGQAKKGAHPKSVVGLVWQAAFADLASAGSNEKIQLLALGERWIADRDVMAFSKNPAMEDFITQAGAGGDEFSIPADFNGDYLAVANTDVNSDKSERYVSSTIEWNIELGADGTASDQVTVTRAHHGNAAPASAWWYRTTNQDWMQVFVPAGSALTNESGGFVKKIVPPINYGKNGYATDPLLLAMQASTRTVFAYPAVSVRDGNASGDPGKEIFSVWDRTYAASSTQVSFTYTHPLYEAPADGVRYEFVIERPSGATGEYKTRIDAPLGYVFAENGLAGYQYDATSTPGRFTIDLTLHKLGE